MKALIVDDERLARNELRRLLQSFPEVDIVGEARNADEAFVQIEQLQPELLFLDIQMPGADGFHLLERLENAPLVIFTTAFDQYALKAFEVNALDYLVKPIALERLRTAIEKVTARSAGPAAAEPSSAESGAPPKGRATASGSAVGQRVFVRDGDRCWFVALEDIALLESEGNYTRLFFGENKPLLLRSLNHLESRLPATLFFRANRRQIINLKFIESIDQWPNGGYQLKLRGGFEITMSRRQALSFQEATKL